MTQIRYYFTPTPERAQNMRTKSQTELRKYRFLHNEMTQEDLGRHLGLSRQSICDIENGKRLPTLTQAYKIAKLLNTTIENLFFPEDKNKNV